MPGLREMANGHQKNRSFDNLSIEEQEKDLEQIRIAKEVFEN